MKNVRYRVVAIVTLSFGLTYADYQPTAQDKQNIEQVNQVLDTVIASDRLRLRNFKKQIHSLAKMYYMNEKLYYMLSEIDSFLQKKLTDRKTHVKLSNGEERKSFIDQHKSDVYTRNTEMNDNCKQHYDVIDDLSFVYDQPTPLVIATRFRESTCAYYLPKNTRWPFQITSKNYGSGEISQELFVQTVEEYLQFVKNKYAMYHNANKKTGEKIDLTYTKRNLSGIVSYAALYNGLSGANIRWTLEPGNPKYLYDNYWASFSWATRDGILTTFLKAANWELGHSVAQQSQTHKDSF